MRLGIGYTFVIFENSTTRARRAALPHKLTPIHFIYHTHIPVSPVFIHAKPRAQHAYEFTGTQSYLRKRITLY